jgi:hypothetical protein
MDYSSLDQAAITLAATAITLGTPFLVAYARQHFKDAFVANAIQAGGGVAYSSLVAAHANGAAPNWDAARQVAIADGVLAAETLAAQAVPAAAVAGALGGLLAADPTVSATGASLATAPSPPGGTAAAIAKPAAATIPA